MRAHCLNFLEAGCGRGWGEIGTINPKLNGGSIRGDTEVTFLPMRCVEELTGHFDLSLTKRFSEVKKGYTPFIDSDLLFAKITPCMENGKVAIVQNLKNGIGFGSTEFHVIRLPDKFPRKFFFYFLIREELRKDAQRNMTGSAGQLRISASFMQQIPIPFPPLPEQRRIVTKLEELFTKLDAGVEALKKTQAQLKRYRSSVLKAACEGKLVPTEAELAKAEGRAYEPADVLLARILKERHEKWKGKGKYKEPAAPDTSGLPALPEGWGWANVGMISEKIQYGTSEKAGGDNSGIPVLRMGNIQDGELIFEDLKYFPKEWPELSVFLLQDEDILFNRTNSAELVGKTAIYKKHHLPAVFASYLIRVRVIKNAYNPDLLPFFINSFYGRKYIGSVVSQQVGQANVNGTKLSQMPIPLPPIAEQRRIVSEVERRLSVAEDVEKTVEQSLKQAERLRQSILKKAFEGKLVPQNPEDEPASVLLERIHFQKQPKKRKG